MPELPEVQAHAERLAAALAGDVLTRVDALNFAALKSVVPPIDGAVGTALLAVHRRGKLLVLDFGTQSHIVHLMQGGRLRLDPARSRRPRGGLVRWVFADAGAYLLTEPGTERKAGVWVSETPEEAPPLAGLGPDADTVAPADMAALLDAHPMRLHGFLRNQSILAGLGRRLANEVCFRARVSPFAQTGTLVGSAADIVAAIRAAVDDSLAEERARADMSTSAQRASLVHNRVGEPCPVCGEPVRAVEYRAYTVAYCPNCQTGGRILADNTLSRLHAQPGRDVPDRPRPAGGRDAGGRRRRR